MPNTFLSRTSVAASVAMLVLACGHSDSFTGATDPLTEPFASSPPFRLTYNAGDNYSPTWTEDGKGLLYLYSRFGLPSDDRCAALLPPSGGTQLWILCDDRREHSDSADSFPSAAIGSDGRLLYVEASSRRGSGGASGVNPPPQTVNLWLADTARPFTRRLLQTFPTPILGVSVNWMTQMQWIGPTSFVALAQVLTPKSGCLSCAFFDSSLATVALVRGEIGASGATLTPIPGASWQRYSLAENNATLIGSGQLDLLRLPLAGGAPAIVASIPAAPGREITGFSCQGSICVVSTSTPVPLAPASYRLWKVSLTGGGVTDIGAGPRDSPLLSPSANDIIGRDILPGSIFALFLYRGLLP